MKALTLTQPWASLVAIGAKKNETRSWSTSYRGPLAIHAAKGFPREAKDFAQCRRVLDLMRPFVKDNENYLAQIPTGAVIATCRVVACVRTEVLCIERQYEADMTEQEEDFGDYSIGRFGWLLEDVKMLPAPIPTKGALGLWEWEPPSPQEIVFIGRDGIYSSDGIDTKKIGESL